jgi:ubiquitin C-terminal hydrolase
MGAVFHDGTLYGGHYTCAAVNDGRWYLFNDSSATEISVRDAHRGSAYILVYEREGYPR